jgi:hypothetical protein
MNKDKFFELVENPLMISQSDVSDLKELVEDYPYFHTAHLLFLKGLHEEKSLKFDHQLQKSAINIPDRKRLYNILFFANKLFEAKLGTKEEIKAEENLLEIIAEDTLTTKKEQPIELLNFNFEEAKKEPKEEHKRENLLEYEYSSKVSDTFLSSDYFTGYNIEDDEPVDEVYLNSFYTFEEWLKMVKNKKASESSSEPEIVLRKENNQQIELIDNFIKESPKIGSENIEKQADADKKDESIDEKVDFITETLAEIYKKQKHYAKAILAYQKLSLKYPEKNSYFADQIKKLEELIKEQ